MQRDRRFVGKGFSSAAYAGLLAICLASGMAWRGVAQELAPDQARTLKGPTKLPFRVGERLQYRVEWAAFSQAASVTLSVPERRNLYGWSTWHFRAEIHTRSPVRSLFEIDDQFDSYTDRFRFETRQFEEHLMEMGRAKTEVMHFADSGEDSKGPGPMVVVLPGTRDPLAALYDLRTVDWSHQGEFRAPVYDGKNMYEMRARRDDTQEAVAVAAGQFSTSRISVELYQYRKEVAGLHFELWLAHDAARTPVLMRADLPFGHIRAELISAKNAPAARNVPTEPQQ